ncbi:MAG: acyl carrier protein [Clostridiales bacterium]|jgi:acyl carrier protein|nr:acyl carrier protein [Clostridiales bacterium]
MQNDLHDMGCQVLYNLQNVVRQYSEIEDIELTEDMVLRSDLGVNSFELIQLVCELEDIYSVEIPDRVVSGFKTVRDVVTFLKTNE